jgi:hypothetical protein
MLTIYLYSVISEKDRKIERNHAFFDTETRKEKRVVSYFCRRILGTKNAARGRNVRPTLEQSPGVHEEGQETRI